MEFNLEQILNEVVLSGSPDLHLHIHKPPYVRAKNGELIAIDKYPQITIEMMTDVIHKITNEIQRKDFEENFETDFSFSISKWRFRVNIYTERHGPGIAFRVISDTIPTLEQIGLGNETERILQNPNGLVLVTGPTGSGKSTTLASMIEYLNANRRAHIITIEDPIEYVFDNRKSLITQREVKVHTKSFANAIRSALRQDPDIVMVGEMRDLETIAAAITLAETGHLVFSTLHTQDAAQTINRIIDAFPSEQQSQIRTQLASTLKAVISQILIPLAQGDGRIAAREILIANDAIRNCISQNQVDQIYSMIQIGSSEGMILMDDALERLVRAGAITKDDAFSKAHDVDMLAQKFSDIK